MGKNADGISSNGVNQGGSLADKSPSNGKNSQQEEEEAPENIGKGAAMLLGGKNKTKNKPKAIETEYLRTDFKLNNIPSPINMK